MNLRRIVLPVLVVEIAAGMAAAFALRSPSVLASTRRKHPNKRALFAAIRTLLL